MVATLVVAVVGSGNLRWFDAALVGYLFGTLFAIFGVTYRYLVWLRRPPTAMLNRRGWQAFRTRGRRGANAAALPGLVASNLLAQGFIRRRSRARWLAHQLVFWGCILAALVTFPLVLGLLHFESSGGNSTRVRGVRRTDRHHDVRQPQRRSAGSSSTCSTSRPCSCSPASSSS